IIGDYTALVGDPSGRDQTRARLTPEQVEKNAGDYLEQISKIIDLSWRPLWREDGVGEKGTQRGKTRWKSIQTGRVRYGEEPPSANQVCRTEVHRNGKWFKRFKFLDVMALTGKIT